MIRYVSCKDYLTPLKHSTLKDLETEDVPAECLRLENERNDGYRVVAFEGSRLIADAEGWAEKYRDVDEFDLACERKFDYAEGPEYY